MTPLIKPFVIHRPPNGLISPVVFDTPHSGTHIPSHISTSATDWERAYLRDCHVEKLLTAVPELGIPVLECLLDRLVIDMNSEEYEIDPASLSDFWSLPFRLTKNVTQRGLGLVATTMKQPDGSLRPIFTEATRPETADIIQRLQQYYRPYYSELETLINRAASTHGFALHVNFHSSPQTEMNGSDIIIGDLKGKSAHPLITDFISNFFAKYGLTSALNSPYAGGALIRKSGKKEHGIHAIQIEFSRHLYMTRKFEHMTKNFEFDPTKGTHLQSVIKLFAQELQDFALANSQTLKAQPAKPATLGTNPP